MTTDEKSATDWFNEGFYLAELGRHKEATHCFDKVLELDPRNQAAWCSKGSCYAEMAGQSSRSAGVKLFQEAVICYSKALEIEPANRNGWLKKGECLSNLSRYEEAIKCYDEVLEIEPADKNGWLKKGKCLWNLSRYEEAIKCYDEVLEIEPADKNGWLNKGNLLGQLGRHEEALKCYDKALEIDPKWRVAWDYKGDCLKELNRHEEAIKCFDEVLQIGPKIGLAAATVWFRKGESLMKLGRYQEAISSYGKAGGPHYLEDQVKRAIGIAEKELKLQQRKDKRPLLSRLKLGAFHIINRIAFLLEKDPVRRLAKLSPEQLNTKRRGIDHEIEASIAEAGMKQQEIERLLLRGADAAEWELDIISQNCAMLHDEIRIIKSSVIALQRTNYIVHMIHLAKKSKVSIATQTLEGFQKMLGAKTKDDMTRAIAIVSQSHEMEAAKIGEVAEDLEVGMAVPEVAITPRAQDFKEQILALKTVESKETREQMAKEKAREMLKE